MVAAGSGPGTLRTRPPAKPAGPGRGARRSPGCGIAAEPARARQARRPAARGWLLALVWPVGLRGAAGRVAAGRLRVAGLRGAGLRGAGRLGVGRLGTDGLGAGGLGVAGLGTGGPGATARLRATGLGARRLRGAGGLGAAGLGAGGKLRGRG